MIDGHAELTEHAFENLPVLQEKIAETYDIEKHKAARSKIEKLQRNDA